MYVCVHEVVRRDRIIIHYYYYVYINVPSDINLPSDNVQIHQDIITAIGNQRRRHSKKIRCIRPIKQLS